VSKFLTPLENIRGIDSPYHAARFISLIPLKRREKPGGEKIEIWHRFNTFLSSVSLII
jgi:centrosomal protein CEP76